jgi:hypothetical protein
MISALTAYLESCGGRIDTPKVPIAVSARS